MDMHGTALIGADFHDANLENVNFNGATLCSGNDRKSCIELRGARVAGADFRNVQWCRELDRICRPVTAAELAASPTTRLTEPSYPSLSAGRN